MHPHREDVESAVLIQILRGPAVHERHQKRIPKAEAAQRNVAVFKGNPSLLVHLQIAIHVQCLEARTDDPIRVWQLGCVVTGAVEGRGGRVGAAQVHMHICLWKNFVREVLEVLEVDILWPRWVARIGVTRSTARRGSGCGEYDEGDDAFGALYYDAGSDYGWDSPSGSGCGAFF